MACEKKRNYLFIIISVSLLMILFACASLHHRLETPTIHIINIEIQDVKSLETIFNVQLRVLNPNDIPIFVKGINCELEINDNHLATGVSNTATEIPAFGNAVLSLEVYSSALDFVSNLIALHGKENLKFKLKGRLKLERGSEIPSYLPFETEKDLLDFKGLMDAQKGD